MKTILKAATLAAILFSANSCFAKETKKGENAAALEDGVLEEKEGHKESELHETAKTRRTAPTGKMR